MRARGKNAIRIPIDWSAVHWFNQTFEGKRTIWMDGRTHPPAYAPHSWMGFSTGRFVGNALMVHTTHLKQGWLRRNGLPESDQATLVEFFVRHGEHLTHTAVIKDPVYLTEPLVKTTDFYRQPIDHENWLFPCDDGEQVLDRAPDDVPNYVFGQNPFVREYTTKYRIPSVGHLGGVATMYPAIAGLLSTASNDASAERPAAGLRVTSQAVDPEPRDGEIHVWPVRDNIYMLAGDEGNIVVQVGSEGPFVVDSGRGALADKTIAAIRRLSDKPIQFIANTSFHVRSHWRQCEAPGIGIRSERSWLVLFAPVPRRGRRRDGHRPSERPEPDGCRQTRADSRPERYVPRGETADVSQWRLNRAVLAEECRDRRRQLRPFQAS